MTNELLDRISIKRFLSVLSLWSDSYGLTRF